nr:class I tRNA ligase family protein [Candidatus Saccharibacteria bacterium]
KNAFKNVITTGVVAGNDGRKMSKSLGNFTDPNELMDKFSADSLRFLLLSSPLLSGEDFTLLDKDVGDVARKLTMLWNMYDFFTMYAEVDGWEWNGSTEDPSDNLENPLDQWIVSRLHQTMSELERNMDAYNIPDALSPVLPFIDDASNWYVRRSRRRFWKSGDDQDKNDAYKTLHYVLTQSAIMLAPFTPFLSEELYHNLTGSTESVHLLDWPEIGAINKLVVNDMNVLRDQITQALSLRAKAGIKIRQPLASVTVPTISESVDAEAILMEELNVKSVENGQEVGIDLNITTDLKEEGLSREIIRVVQNARKKAGLNVDDRIKLNLSYEQEIEDAINHFKVIIANETLSTDLSQNANKNYSYTEEVKVDGTPITISLEKAGQK